MIVLNAELFVVCEEYLCTGGGAAGVFENMT